MRLAVLASSLVAASLFAAPVVAAEHASWDEYTKANRYKCPGPIDTLKTPRTVTLAGKTYTHTGYKLEVQNPDADTATKLGVISAIKDVAPGTKENIKTTFDWFKAQKVEWVVVNGDIALEELDLEEVIGLIAEQGLPTVLVLGNSESKSSFARVYKELADKYPNIINGVFVRQLILDDVELWNVSGYHDKRFVHQGAGCVYSKADIDALLALKPSGKGALAIVAHGPPAGTGKYALDWITDKKNVGDPELTRLIKTSGASIGLFGHILEAGGQVTGKDLTTPVAPLKLVPNLYINAGSLSGDPWGLNDGSTSTGMAFIVTIEGQQSKYEIKKLKPAAEE